MEEVQRQRAGFRDAFCFPLGVEGRRPPVLFPQPPSFPNHSAFGFDTDSQQLVGESVLTSLMYDWDPGASSSTCLIFCSKITGMWPCDLIYHNQDFLNYSKRIRSTQLLNISSLNRFCCRPPYSEIAQMVIANRFAAVNTASAPHSLCRYLPYLPNTDRSHHAVTCRYPLSKQLKSASECFELGLQ